VQTSLLGIAQNNRPFGVLLVLALFPLFYAVAMAMNVAPKVNIESEDLFREIPRGKRIGIALLIIVFSPLIYIYLVGHMAMDAVWFFRTLLREGLLPAPDSVLKISSLLLGILLTVITVAMAIWPAPLS
jgi:hypothetical protein